MWTIRMPISATILPCRGQKVGRSRKKSLSTATYTRRHNQVKGEMEYRKGCCVYDMV